MKEGKYIYAIIKETANKNFGPIGINNQKVSLVHYKPSTRAKLGAGPVPHRNEVSGAGNISAVTSDTPIINFDRLDKEELTRHVACHQKVNEELMKDYDICPMAFGIIAPSVDEVLGILERAYLQFKTALKKIEGKTEFAVQVWWDRKKLLEELTKTNPEIQKLLRRGIQEMLTKLKFGKLIQKEMESRRETFINDIHTFLGNLSYDSTQNKLIDDDMIANLSFLIEKAKEPELDGKMQELGKKYEGKLRFKYIGPMPPYSFVNINLSLGNFEVVNKARKLLGLGEEATFDEIKTAYYKLSHQYHPDKFQGAEDYNPPTASSHSLRERAPEMKKITQAYSILENYCRSCDELAPHQNLVGGEGQKSQKYSFKKEDVENSLIIKNL